MIEFLLAFFPVVFVGLLLMAIHGHVSRVKPEPDVPPCPRHGRFGGFSYACNEPGCQKRQLEIIRSAMSSRQPCL